MEELRKNVVVKGYGNKYSNIYDMTISGRIIIKKSNKARHSKGNEYGYANVHFHKDGERKLFKTFDIWKATFPNVAESEYKGMK